MGQTKSFNCCSCGAGLPNPNGNTVKCRYCGNYNKILPSGMVTLTFPIHTNKKEEEEIEWNDLSFKQKFYVVMVMIVCPVILARHYKR